MCSPRTTFKTSESEVISCHLTICVEIWPPWKYMIFVWKYILIFSILEARLLTCKLPGRLQGAIDFFDDNSTGWAFSVGEVFDAIWGPWIKIIFKVHIKKYFLLLSVRGLHCCGVCCFLASLTVLLTLFVARIFVS